MTFWKVIRGAGVIIAGGVLLILIGNYVDEINWQEWKIKNRKAIKKHDQLLHDFREGEVDTFKMDYGLGFTLEITNNNDTINDLYLGDSLRFSN